MNNQDSVPESDSPAKGKSKTQPFYFPIAVAFLSVVIYITACVLPALEFIHTDGTHDELMIGANVLAMGWCGIFMLNLAWFANPFYIVSVVLLWLRKYKASIISATVALIIGAQTFLLFGHQWLADEAGIKHFQLKAIHIGTYIWLLSILIVLPAAYFCKRLDRQKNP